MKTNNIRLNLSLFTTTLAGLTLLSLTGNSALAANWTITDLGDLGAAYSFPYESRAYNINNAGQVAGKGVVLVGGVPEMHYVVWSNGTQIDLGIRINSSNVDSAPINDAGQVAGVIEDERSLPFLWQNGVVTRLAVLPDTYGDGVARVNGINASGAVVGLNGTYRGGGRNVAVRWQGGTVTDLGLDFGEPTGINDHSHIAINGLYYFTGQSGVLAGGVTNVVAMPGLHPSYGLTEALDLNNAGQVCGRFIVDRTVDSRHHAFLWQGGIGTPLPEYAIGVSSESEAVALNNRGHAVGWAAAASGNPALLWRDGGMTNLSALPEVTAAGWWGLTARDINDHDQIVGMGYHNHGGHLTAFLLSPVVVPSLTIKRSGTDGVLSFPTQTGVRYQLQSSTALTAASWLDVGVPYVGTGGVLSANVTIGPEPKKFFRLRLLDN
jgi:uncharacterized membrane protein